MFRNFTSNYLRKEGKKHFSELNGKSPNVNPKWLENIKGLTKSVRIKYGLIFVGGISFYSTFKYFKKKENLLCEEISNDKIEDLLSENLKQDIEDVILERKNLDHLYEEINILFKKIDARISSDILFEKISEDLLSDLDQEWILLSEKVSVFTSKLKNFRDKCQIIDKNKSYAISLLNPAILKIYDDCKVEISKLTNVEDNNFLKIFQDSFNVIVDDVSSKFPEIITNSSLDIKTLLYYFYKKNKILQSVKMENFMNILKRYKEESDDELNALSQIYRDKICQLDKQINEPQLEKINDLMAKFIRDYTSSFYQQMITALNQQREDIEALFSQREKIYHAEVLLDVENKYQPIIDSVNSIQKIVDYNNSLLQQVEKYIKLTESANKIILCLNSKYQKSKPLYKYINEIYDNSDNENIKLIIEKIPRSAKENGIYSQFYLIDQLPDLVKKSKNLVFSNNDELNSKIKLISTFHSIFRIKNPLLNSDKLDLTDEIMKTYDVLDNMELYINNRDIISCIKSILSLTGNSRHVFDEWVTSAIDSVETKLLSELLHVSLNSRKIYIE